MDYQKVFERAPDGVLIVGAGGRIEEANPVAHQMFGYDEGELVGLGVDALVPDRVRPHHAVHRERYHADPHPRPMGIGMELSGRRKNGSEVPVEISLSPVGDQGEGRLIAIVRDVSERRRLRDFGAGALRAAEDERLRIARELHDDTAQALAAILMRLRVLQREGPSERWDDWIDELRRQLSDAAEGVRRIARGLRPPAIEDAGLVAALQSLVRGVQEGHDIRVSLDAEAVDEGVEPDRRLVVYRIVQEALANAARHAAAPTASVRVHREAGQILVEVSDTGTGFDPSAIESGYAGRSGLGLMGMRERAAAAGGTLHIRSSPGQGTTVSASIPAAIRGGESENA